MRAVVQKGLEGVTRTLSAASIRSMAARPGAFFAQIAVQAYEGAKDALQALLSRKFRGAAEAAKALAEVARAVREEGISALLRLDTYLSAAAAAGGR